MGQLLTKSPEPQLTLKSLETQLPVPLMGIFVDTYLG